MKKSNNLRTAIKRLRKKLGLTQEQFAQAVGVTWVTVARWEKKKGSSPSKLAKEKLKGLGLPAKDRR